MAIAMDQTMISTITTIGFCIANKNTDPAPNCQRRQRLHLGTPRHATGWNHWNRALMRNVPRSHVAHDQATGDSRISGRCLFSSQVSAPHEVHLSHKLPQKPIRSGFFRPGLQPPQPTEDQACPVKNYQTLGVSINGSPKWLVYDGKSY